MEAEARAHLGPALDAFKYVPSDVADRLLGPMPEPRDLADAKRDAVIFAREIGVLQTGRPVDAGWAFRCLSMLGEEALGVVDWHPESEHNVLAVNLVVEAAREQVRLLRSAAIGKECAEKGAPF